jgi:hypothetical protein
MTSSPALELPNPVTEPTISVVRAGGILGAGRDASYRMVKDGQIPVIHCGRFLKVPSALFLSQTLGLILPPVQFPEPVDAGDASANGGSEPKPTKTARAAPKTRARPATGKRLARRA